MPFSSFELDPKLLRAVDACGFTSPTEIQQQAIPIGLSGQDLMASAQTGTGKTAAFALPALQKLLVPSPANGRGPRVLVLTPTRELAGQVSDSFKQLGRFARLRVATIVGGVAYPPQERLLRGGLDVLVATPGRLIDHMNQGRVDFSRLELLVLDEADRMLDMGFSHDVEHIAAALPDQRQTLLFSATLEGDVAAVAGKLLRNPARIQVASVRDNHASISQQLHLADDFRHKKALLSHLLENPDLSQAIVFTATKRSADQLAENLAKQGYACAALHGDMRQGSRLRTVEQLRRRKLRFLVATDVAARGLDIKGISHVINFDLPMAAEDYIHRIGRTGRAGATGVATSLVGPDDWDKLARIERLTGRRIEREVIAGLEPRHPEARFRSNNAPRHANQKRYANRGEQRFSPSGSRTADSQQRTGVKIRFKQNKRGRVARSETGSV